MSPRTSRAMLATAALWATIADHLYIALLVINTVGVAGGMIYGAANSSVSTCVGWGVSTGILHAVSWATFTARDKSLRRLGWALGAMALLSIGGLVTNIAGWWSL